MKRFLAFFVAFVTFFTAFSQQLDSIRVSLLTCSPGPKVYSLYGHTAIRCQNFTRDLDLVFNYGVFTFDQPHFVWRFILGKCDYMVDAMEWRFFPSEYGQRGSSVTAQVLNLTPLEANRLYLLLIQNLRPENREYRYNFLYNNCTTKVRDVIEEAVEGVVEYPQLQPRRTYRQILHEYTAGYPWSQEGNDFLLGHDVDTVLSSRAEMFAPEFLMRYADGANIHVSKNDVRPLVSRTEIIVQKKDVPTQKDDFPTPLEVCYGVLLCCLLVMAIEWKWHRMWWGLDVLLMSFQGLAGLLIAFMFFFSQHPAVGSNWLIWIFNPYPLIGLPVVVKAAIKHKHTPWHAMNFVILTLFILFSPWIPQEFGNMVVPLALAFLSRPVSYLLHYRNDGISTPPRKAGREMARATKRNRKRQ